MITVVLIEKRRNYKKMIYKYMPKSKQNRNVKNKRRLENTC